MFELLDSNASSSDLSALTVACPSTTSFPTVVYPPTEAFSPT